KTYDGTTASTAAGTATGLVGGDTATVGPQVFDSRNAGPRTLHVTSYTVNDGNGGNNYAVTVNDARGQINRANLTISSFSDVKVFDGNTTSKGVRTSTGLVAGDTLTVGPQVFDLPNVGSRTMFVTGYTLADGNGGNNYNVTLMTAPGFITATGRQAQNF